eukprot:gene8625-11658_t
MVKKERVGIVVSNKPQKTIVVAIQIRYQHPMYGKTLIKTKRYMAHDEKNECKAGDLVLLEERNNRKYANVGDIIIGVVKDAIPNMAIKRSNIVRAVIVRTRKTLKRADGMAIRFDDNAAVIINAENNPRGTRVFGPVAREIREKNFTKIISLAAEVI